MPHHIHAQVNDVSMEIMHQVLPRKPIRDPYSSQTTTTNPKTQNGYNDRSWLYKSHMGKAPEFNQAT